MSYPRNLVGAYPFVSIQDPGPPRFLPYGPWIDIVGAEAYPEMPRDHLQHVDAARRATWQETHALIKSAISDMFAAMPYAGQGIPWTPAGYVWGLKTDGSIEVTPAPSREAGLNDLRDRTVEGDYVAIALFDRSSPHWPNPVTWHKEDDPAYYGVIAQQIARHAPHVAGDAVGYQGFPWGYEIVGGGPWGSIVGGEWYTIVGQALDALRRQAQAAAEEMPGRVIGVVRDASNQWKLKSFRTVDSADDWFGHATHNPSRFTYAAYFDKDDPLFPHPLNEVIGDAHEATKPGSIPRVIAETHP